MGKTKPENYPKGSRGWLLVDGDDGELTLKDMLGELSESHCEKLEREPLKEENAGDGRAYAYARGVMVGMVAAFMACGMTQEDAHQLVWQRMPNDTHPLSVPKEWRQDFTAKYPKHLRGLF